LGDQLFVFFDGEVDAEDLVQFSDDGDDLAAREKGIVVGLCIAFVPFGIGGRIDAFVFAVLVFLPFEAVATGLVGEMDAESAGELKDAGGVLLEGLGIRFALVAHEELVELHEENHLVRLADALGVIELLDEIGGAFVFDLEGFEVLLLVDPFLVSAEFPAGDVLVGDPGIAEFSELRCDVVIGDAVVEELVDGLAG